MHEDTNVQHKLLRAAKAEFLRCGYQKASLRQIAQTAGVSTGSVYFFFGSKEALFCAAVKDAADALRTMLTVGTQQEYSGEVSGEDNDRAFIQCLQNYPEESMILLEKSQDSPMAGFRGEIVALLEQGFMAFLLRSGGEEADADLIRLLVEQRVHAVLTLSSRRYDIETTMRYNVLIGAYGDTGFAGMMEKYHQIRKSSAG